MTNEIPPNYYYGMSHMQYYLKWKHGVQKKALGTLLMAFVYTFWLTGKPSLCLAVVKPVPELKLWGISFSSAELGPFWPDTVGHLTIPCNTACEQETPTDNADVLPNYPHIHLGARKHNGSS